MRRTAADIACTQGGLVAPYTYRQLFGAWPDGATDISNTPLESLALASGTYTLHVYGGHVGADNGSLAIWELCFDAPAAPRSCCIAGTTSDLRASARRSAAQPAARGQS